MKPLFNIEKSRSQFWPYVGWRKSDGAIHLIKRYHPQGEWTAFNRDDPCAPYYTGRTLSDLSSSLETA